MINTKLQSIIDTKSAIGNAIVNKGGTVTSATPFFNYASEINNISTGTPQTVFQDSTGAKWARTNAVNLTNVSNNVTSDFNWWQPANNTTSDSIMTIGTVNGNISGNIRIVQINQVNIAQYENIVATDTTGAKYVGYNGYDFATNPTPTGNNTFNRWVLNNSASGTVIFANGTFISNGTYNGLNSTANISNMAFISNSAQYDSGTFGQAINNGFIFIGGNPNNRVRKLGENDLGLYSTAPGYGSFIFAVTVNDGFVYAGGGTVTSPNRGIAKYYESNLGLVGNTVNYGATIQQITTNAGAIYASGLQVIKKYSESSLGFMGETSPNYGGTTLAVTVKNGLIYTGGSGPASVYIYGESSLSFLGNTVAYGVSSQISSIVVNNGFIYVGGLGNNNTIQKFGQSNLAFVGNTAPLGGWVRAISIADGFIYGSGDNPIIQKFYENNLAFVSNTNSFNGDVLELNTNNGFIFASGASSQPTKKFQQRQLIADTQTLYTATKIKE
jgi:hypothetical protein